MSPTRRSHGRRSSRRWRSPRSRACSRCRGRRAGPARSRACGVRTRARTTLPASTTIARPSLPIAAVNDGYWPLRFGEDRHGRAEASAGGAPRGAQAATLLAPDGERLAEPVDGERDLAGQAVGGRQGVDRPEASRRAARRPTSGARGRPARRAGRRGPGAVRRRMTTIARPACGSDGIGLDARRRAGGEVGRAAAVGGADDAVGAHASQRSSTCPAASPAARDRAARSRGRRRRRRWRAGRASMVATTAGRPCAGPALASRTEPVASAVRSVVMYPSTRAAADEVARARRAPRSTHQVSAVRSAGSGGARAPSRANP